MNGLFGGGAQRGALYALSEIFRFIVRAGELEVDGMGIT